MDSDDEKEIAEREHKAQREMEMKEYVVDEAPDQMGDLLIVSEPVGSKATAQHGYAFREFQTDIGYSDEMLDQLLDLKEDQRVRLRDGLHPTKDVDIIKEID